MAKYERFEDLPVWRTAIELAVKTFELTRGDSLRRYASLCNQLERAAVSVSNHIAEGFERGSHAELVAFRYVARGSAGEVRSMLLLLERLEDVACPSALLDELKKLSRSACRQIGAWPESLKDSAAKGPRFETPQSRRSAQESRRAEQFLAQLRDIQRKGASPTDPPSEPS